MGAKTIPYQVIKDELLQDAQVRQAYDALELAQQVARARSQRGLTQEELAQRIGTKQSSIARLESGKAAPRAATLEKIAKALGCRLTIRLEPCDDGSTSGA
ncbi:MAG: helix-turn-helix domain-containing protein [Anaerolineae bacterium]